MIDGLKKKAKKQRQPVVAKDTARSRSYTKVMIALAEGEVEGREYGRITDRDIFFDGVPLMNEDGTRNYDVEWDFRNGTIDQDYIPAMPMTESDTQVSYPLKATAPWTRRITNNQVDNIRLRFMWPALVNNKDNGDRVGVRVQYAIDLAIGTGSFQEIQRHTIADKSTQRYDRSHTLELPRSEDGWTIRVRRLTPDATTDMLQDAMYVESYTEIIDAKLTYPHTALLYVKYDSEDFPNSPKIHVQMKGRIIRVPENYNPETRVYSGVWSGRWKWAYTNNPAWVIMDLITSDRFGAGKRLTLDQVDKWSLYEIARWCDGMVPDGQGGMQPRHTVNVCIQSQQDAWRVLGDFASIFNGVTYWNGQQIEVQADMPRDADYVFTNGNVIDGKFEYASVGLKNKASMAMVKYNNPANEYEVDTVPVHNESLTARYGGVYNTDVAAFGCSVYGEALRKGQWALLANKYGALVKHTTGLEGYLPKLGRIYAVADSNRAGAMIGGRVKSVGAKELSGARAGSTVILAGSTKIKAGEMGDTHFGIRLDRDARAKVGDKITINGADGVAQVRTITQVIGSFIQVDRDFEDIAKNAVWAIESNDLRLQYFKAITITQDAQNRFTIHGAEYNKSKFDYIDSGAELDDRPITITPATEQEQPTGLKIEQYNYTQQGLSITNLRFSWQQTPGAVRYEVQWRKDRMQWVNIAPTSGMGVDLEGVYSGLYEFRVRALNAMDIASVFTQSEALQVTGKIGDPPALAFLRTTSEVMGIRLDWGFPAKDAEDTARTEIQVSARPNGNGSLLGEFSYPTSTHTHAGLAHATELYFRGRLVDRTGNIGPWSDWVHGSSSMDSDEILSYLDGQIKDSHLDKWLKEEIEKIDDIEVVANEAGVNAQNALDGLTQSNIDLNARIDELQAEIQELETVDFFDPELSYSKGDMVKFDNIIYAAKQDVPAGIAPPNDEYWENIGGFESVNDIVSALVTEVRKHETEIQQNKNSITTISQQQNALSGRVTDAEKGITGNSNAIDTLRSRVTQNENDIASQSESITSLSNSIEVVDGKAEAAQKAANEAHALAETKADSSAVQSLTSRVEKNERNISSQSTAITQLGGSLEELGKGVNKKADSTALQALDAKVTLQGDKITSQGSAITNLASSLSETDKKAQQGIDDAKKAQETANKKADATALQALDTKVSEIEGNVTSQSQSIIKLESGLEATDEKAQQGVDDAKAAQQTANKKADATALQSLDTKVSGIDGRVTAQASSLSQLTSKVDGNTSAIQSEAEARADADTALGKRINTVQSGVDSNKAAIQSEAQTRASADGALSQRIDTVQATTGSNSASIQSIQQAQASTDGKLNAMHGVKLQLASDGKWVNAGYTIGIDGETMQSTTIFDTNNFLIRNGVNGQSQTMFAVQGNQTIIRSALIGDATITMAKIGGDLFSSDWVAGKSGWRLRQNGQFEINSSVAGQGRIEINNKGVRVYDANGRIRVKLGDLR